MKSITLKSIVLGLLLIPLNCYWVTVVEVRWYTLDGSCLPLFVTPLFMLFAVTVLNLAMQRWRARWALTQGELRVVYIMLVMSSTLNGHDMIQNLFGSIAHAYQFNTPANQWSALFFDYLPRWLLMGEADALKAFYDGGRSIYSLAALRPWLVPLGNWAVIVLAMILVMLCLNILLRRQWTEKEKLGFPLIQLPLQLTMGGGEGTLFRNRMMWAGFAVAGSIVLMNGLHVLYPQVPYLAIIKQYDLRQHITERPWTAIRRMTISMYPFAIGLAFFLPTDLSFSCWFFYVLRMAEEVLGAMFGWEKAKGFPYFNQQASGAWLALALIALWGCRRVFREAWQTAWQHRVKGVTPNNPQPATLNPEVRILRWAFVGLGFGTALLVGITMLAGMSLWVAVLFYAIYFLLALAITRVRAELGTPHEIYFVNPQRILVETLGTQTLGVRNLTVLSVFYWFNRCYRCHPMPNQMEAFKIGEQSRMETGKLIGVIALATIAGLLFSYWANLHVCYTQGATAKCVGFKRWVGHESFANLQTWINAPVQPEATNLGFIAVGFLLTLGLKALRSHFTALPFHPAGYGLAVSFAMDYFWFAFFISWLIKIAVLRYGSLKTHKKAISFMLGMILGDYICGSIWAIIGPTLGRETYKIFI
ncbi:MAG: hypothetical protein NZT92_07050 [Abditibacteriales bacterium]|nr:hypothetical protein [Abditibacteriales bacterium]MDW8365619.1 DUF6785 family protein [Abditibacteriales bacterium]